MRDRLQAEATSWVVPIVVVVMATLITVAIVVVADDDANDDLLTLQDILDTTPPPPSGPVPTQNPNMPGFVFPTSAPTEEGPMSVEVGGVTIPIPDGAHYGHFGSPGGRLNHHIWLDDAVVEEPGGIPRRAEVDFDEFGLLRSELSGFDDVFAPTLDAIWVLAQEAGTPSPASMIVGGVELPLPGGSYFNTIDTPTALAGDLVAYYVRLERSVVAFTILNSESAGLLFSNIAPGATDLFQPTLDAIDAQKQAPDVLIARKNAGA